MQRSRDDHGNGIPTPIGNPMGIPWKWELMTQLGMGMGMALIPMGINSHRRMQCLAYVIVTYSWI